MQTSSAWYTSIVSKGTQIGRTIGYPTVNLDPCALPKRVKEGVYAANVKYQNRVYGGALYLGPRLVLNEAKIILEIYILGFDQEIYGEEIQFQIKDFVRGALNFLSFEELKEQLNKDVLKVKELLANKQAKKHPRVLSSPVAQNVHCATCANNSLIEAKGLLRC